MRAGLRNLEWGARYAGTRTLGWLNLKVWTCCLSSQVLLGHSPSGFILPSTEAD